MARFGIGSRKFSQAVDVIKAHREMGSRLGFEFELAHLTDEHAYFVVEQWATANPPRSKTDDGLGTDYFKRDIAEAYERVPPIHAATTAVVAKLSADEIADFEVIYYVGTLKLFSEEYPERLTRTLKEHQLENRPWEKAYHIMTKSTLPQMLARGVEILGRPTLAATIRNMRADFAS